MSRMMCEVFRVRRPAAWLLGLAVAVVVSCGAGSVARAQSTATWTGGGGSGDWQNPANWTVIPTTSGSWALVFGGVTQTTGTNGIGTITLNSLSFTNDGSTGNTSVFSISGSTGTSLALSSGTISTTAATGGSLANPGDVVSSSLTLAGANTVSLGAGHNLTITGGITGAGSLSVNASGTGASLFLTGSNGYSGGTTITSGLVQNGLRNSSSDFSSSAFGAGTVVVSGSGSAVIRNNSTIGNDFTIAGVGSVTGTTTNGALRGSFGISSQTATLTGTVTLTGDAVIKTAASSGVTGSSLVLQGPVNLGANVLTFSPGVVNSGTTAVPIVVSGTVSGAGSIVVDGDPSSRVVLGAANQYTGGTTIVASTLAVGSSTALGSGAVAVKGGTLDLNGRALSIGTLSGSSGGLITSTVSGTAASLTTTSNLNSTYAGAITDGAGVVSLTKTGTGGLYLTGSNSFSGGTVITSGLVQNGLRSSLADFNNNAFGAGGVVVSGSGSAVIRNSSFITNNFSIAGVGSVSGTTTNGAIRGSFGLSGQTARLTGGVTLTDNATIKTAASAGVTGSKLSLEGAIDLGSNVLTFAPGFANSGTAPLPIVVSGTIGGSGSVVVDGASAVYLNAANTYTGSTTVAAGTLGGNGSVQGAVIVQNGAVISPGADVNTYGSFGVGSLQLDAGSTAAMSIGGTSVGLYDQIVALGSVTYGGTLAIDFATAGFAVGDLWQLFSGSSHSGNFSSITATGAYGNLVFNYQGSGEWVATGGLLNSGESLLFFVDNSHAIGDQYKAGQLVLVPEPSTFVCAAIGMGIFGMVRWKRAPGRRRAKVVRAAVRSLRGAFA